MTYSGGKNKGVCSLITIWQVGKNTGESNIQMYLAITALDLLSDGLKILYTDFK